MDLDERVAAWTRQHQKLESLVQQEAGRRFPDGAYMNNLQRWKRTLENKIAASNAQIVRESPHEPPISGLR